MKSNYESPCIKFYIMQEQDVITTSGTEPKTDGNDNLFKWGWNLGA